MMNGNKSVSKDVKKLGSIGRIEETKMNFFNHHNHQEDELTDEEHQILEARIDPIEWKHEIDRVYGQLNSIQKEIEVWK